MSSGLAFGLVAVAAREARAAPIEFVEQRDQYMIFEDVSGQLEQANWFVREPFLAAFRDIEAGFLAAHPDDSQFLIVYTTWRLPSGIGALYQAVANEVQGIGYEHIAPLDAVIPAPYFDDTPDSQVFGFMHMNDWTFYLGTDKGGVDETWISLVFGQELGHAWLSFVHYIDDDGVERDDLLGRSQAHWSFYVHSGGSPLEGHDWRDNGDGTYTAFKRDFYEFSDFGLYLMGLMPAEEVEPWFVLDEPSNCIDSAQGSDTCAPVDAHQFAADSYTVTATRRDVTIADVIAAEGPRIPSYGDAPTQFDAAFLLLTRPGETLSEAEKQQMDVIVARSLEVFNRQTRGRGAVRNRTAKIDDDTETATSGDTGSSSASTTATNDRATVTSGGNGASDGGRPGGVGGAVENDADATGCTCRSDGRDSSAVGFIVLVGIGFVRARRVRRTCARDSRRRPRCSVGRR